jgi:hypothetical protein
MLDAEQWSELFLFRQLNIRPQNSRHHGIVSSRRAEPDPRDSARRFRQKDWVVWPFPWLKERMSCEIALQIVMSTHSRNGFVGRPGIAVRMPTGIEQMDRRRARLGWALLANGAKLSLQVIF